ncbi:MAG: hypothetical protein KAI28_08990, partial [Sphingomonadales bacterium]|nr:hypothetical protein [Sphingomonadales bacterium]
KNGLDRIDGQNTTHFQNEPATPNTLSNNNIRAITQDRDGTIWVGTLNGLNRFNGKSFERYFAENGAPGSISGNNILALTADVNGGIWIGVNGIGMDFYDGTAFTSFKLEKGNPRSLPSRYPKALWPDDTGAGVWVGTNNMGLAHIDLNTGEAETHLPMPDNPSSEVHNFVRSITPGENGLLWLATNAGVFSFDTSTNAFRDRVTTEDGLPSNTIMSIDTDGLGSLWIGMSRGLSRLNPENATVRNYKFGSGMKKPSFLPNASAHDERGGNYFGTQYGLLTFNPIDMKDNANPPPVVLTGMSLFDEEVQPGAEDGPLDTTLITANELTLNYDQSFFSFTFAALDFSAPGDNAYAYKLEGF